MPSPGVFAEEKRARNLCDFHDMEHLALSILVDEEGQPTDTAKELSGRFREIMIDEYQDSNLVQEADSDGGFQGARRTAEYFYGG